MKNKQNQELAVCGFEAVKALAERHPESIQRLFFTQDRARFFGPVCKYLASVKRIYRVVETPQELERLSQSVHHQGVVAMIREPDVPQLDEPTFRAWQDARERVLFLDRVGNANNLGAIVRSAAFFGVSKILISAEDEQAQVSTSSWRVAQGGMEYVEIRKVSSAAALFKAAAGRMNRIGADHRASSRLSEIRDLIDPSLGVLIALGNEETGLSADLRSSCDRLVRIPGTGEIESLNVAQAATLFLYELSAL